MSRPRQYDPAIPPDFTTVRPLAGQRRKFVGFRNAWDSGKIELRYQEVTRLQFVGCMLTAETDDEIWLDVRYFAEFLRDVRGQCAFCHGDPCAERSAPDSLIAREYECWKNARWASDSGYFTCPCCQGRPS